MELVNFRQKTWKKRLGNWSSLLICLLTSAQLSGQIIVPGAFIENQYPLFSKDSIRHHGIQEITIRQMRKPSSRPIYDDGNRTHYTFNRKGELTQFLKIYPGWYGHRDSSSIQFDLVNGDLKSKTIAQGKYRKRIDYLRKNDSVIIETAMIKRGKENWESMDREAVRSSTKSFKGNRVLIQFRGGLDAEPYQREITQFTKEQRKDFHEVWVGPRLIKQEKWRYENGLVSAYSNDNLQDQKSFQIYYSTDSPLQDNGSLCKDGKCREWSLVYYENGLPKGWIIIESESQDMEIWEFRYRYF